MPPVEFLSLLADEFLFDFKVFKILPIGCDCTPTARKNEQASMDMNSHLYLSATSAAYSAHIQKLDVLYCTLGGLFHCMIFFCRNVQSCCNRIKGPIAHFT